VKLLYHTQRLFLQIASPVFLLAGFVLYETLQGIFNKVAEERLAQTQTEVEEYVAAHNALPPFFQTTGSQLWATPVASPAATHFSDTLLLNRHENEQEPFRCCSFAVHVQGQWYRIDLCQTVVEQEDLLAAVAVALVLLFALLLGAALWANRRVASRVWQPFFATLERMRRFALNDPAPLHLAPTPVQEFQELNQTLETLTQKVQSDFRTVQQFTENASHELQTPLAVIQNKVEQLLQDESLTETQARQLDVLAQSTHRMARLNQALLLLAKIENRQFAQREHVAFKPLLEKKLRWLEDFVWEKKLVLQLDLADKSLEINPLLAETLVTNLLTNAVKHNLPDGLLKVALNNRQLVVNNSAAPPQVPVDTLTSRFARGHSGSEGLGLGLAIVQEICSQQGWTLHTEFADGHWRTVVIW
jgi:signal transduction histidine kinase